MICTIHLIEISLSTHDDLPLLLLLSDLISRISVSVFKGKAQEIHNHKS